MPFGPFYAALPSDGGAPPKRYVDSTSWDAVIDNFINWKGNVNGGGFTLSNVIFSGNLTATTIAISTSTLMSTTTQVGIGIAIAAGMPAKLHVHSATAGQQMYVSGVGPSIQIAETAVLASATMQGIVALATVAGHYALAAGDLLIGTYGSAHGNIYINPNYNGGAGKSTFIVGDVNVSGNITGTVFVGGTSITGTAGSTFTPLRAVANSGNGEFLRHTIVRTAAGADWNTAEWRLERIVDTSQTGYVAWKNNNISLWCGFTTPVEVLRATSLGVLMPVLQASTSYANDAAAAVGGVVVGQLYRNGSIVMVRVA